jgi:hypothetical protein
MSVFKENLPLIAITIICSIALFTMFREITKLRAEVSDLSSQSMMSFSDITRNDMLEDTPTQAEVDEIMESSPPLSSAETKVKDA